MCKQYIYLYFYYMSRESLTRFLYTPSNNPSIRPSLELDKYQKNAVQLVQAGYNLFITGSAGSGKSFLIRKCIEECRSIYQEKNISVTSTTGISSLNIHGITIHSWAGITPHTNFTDVNGFVENIKGNYKKYNNWKFTKLLIIDEISMLSVVMFNFLHEVAMKLRRNSEPFGGIQVIVVGDFFQLPPVKDSPDTDFVFTSSYWEEIIDYSIVLKKTHRQKEMNLISFLNKIRIGIKDESVQSALLQYHNNPNYNKNYTHLYPNKFNVNAHNLTKVYALEGDIVESYARMIKKTSYDYPFPNESVIEEKLMLKLNAFVIINKNIDAKKGLVNGRQGIFLGFSNESARFQTKDGMIHYISKERWEFPNYIIEQYPLRLAWALTIHKSQGMGIEKLSVDIGSNIFDDGQVYVALSRATNSDYLHIKKYSLSAIRVNQKVKKYYKQLQKKTLEWYRCDDDPDNVYYQNKINGCTKRTLPNHAIIIEKNEDLEEDDDTITRETNIKDTARLCQVCGKQPYEKMYKQYYNENVCFHCSINDDYYMELNKEGIRKKLYISKKNIREVLSSCSSRGQSNRSNSFSKRYIRPTKLYLLGHARKCNEYM